MSEQKLLDTLDELLWELDPIGINDICPRDEYSSYVPELVTAYFKEGSVEAVLRALSEDVQGDWPEDVPLYYPIYLEILQKMDALLAGYAKTHGINRSPSS